MGGLTRVLFSWYFFSPIHHYYIDASDIWELGNRCVIRAIPLIGDSRSEAPKSTERLIESQMSPSRAGYSPNLNPMSKRSTQLNNVGRRDDAEAA